MSDSVTSFPLSSPSPTVSTESGTVTLKVLTGSQMGVEVNLPDGQFTFGSDEAADVRFLDVTMAPLHGQIRIGGGKIQLQATGGVIVTGSGLAIEPGGDSWHEVAQLDRVRAGMTHFALGERAARWTDVLDESDDANPAPTRRNAASVMEQGRRFVVPAVAVLVVLAVVGLVWQGNSTTGQVVSQTDSTTIAAELQAAIDAFPFGPVLDLEIEADGRGIVSGYVNTAAERRAVEAAIADIDPNTRRRIWVREAMHADINGMIDSQGLDVSSTIAQDGILRLEGRVLDPEQAGALVSMINNEVFGVSGIDDRIETAEDILSAVDTLLVQAGLHNVVIARLDGLLIETTGVIPNSRADLWIGFVQTYANRYADILPLRSFVTLESDPSDVATIPLVVGGEGQLNGLEGRRLPTERLGPDQDLRLDEVFGSFSGQRATAQDDVSAEDAEDPSPGASPVATAMVLDFAARNPALVDTIIREVTGGRFGGLEELRALPSPDASNQTAEGVTVSSLAGRGIPARSAVEQFAELLETGSAQTAPTASDGSNGAMSSAEPDSAFARFPTLRTADLGILGATGTLLRQENLVGMPMPNVPRGSASIDGVRPDLLRLALEHQAAIEQGESLLPPAPTLPAPLSAQPVDPIAESSRGCWRGANVDPADIPAALLWLDMLSLGEQDEFNRLDVQTQLQVFDVALSPGRLVRCVWLEQVDYGQQLIQASAFLNEIWRNKSFLDYVFRDVPRIELPVSGVDLSGERRVVLEGQRVLREGGAPDAASRIEVIGELGALLRVSDGYRLSLYPPDLDWAVEE